MDENQRKVLKIKNRRRKVSNYLRKETLALNVKKSLNIRYMERVLSFRKGKIQKFITRKGKLTDEEIMIIHEHLKKLTRF